MTLKREPAADLPDSVAALVLVGKTAKEKKKNTGTRRGMRWAERLWRIYSVNVTACACGGQRKMVSLVDDAYAACTVFLVSASSTSGCPPTLLRRSPRIRQNFRRRSGGTTTVRCPAPYG